MSNYNQLFNDAINSLIDRAQKMARDNAAYDAIDQDMAGNRGDYANNIVDKMAEAAISFYEWFADDLYYDKGDDYAWDQAIALIHDVKAAEIAVKEGTVGDRLSNQDYNFFQDTIDEFRQLTRERQQWNTRSHTRDRRGVSQRWGNSRDRGDTRRGSTSGARGGRGNDRQQGRSMFTEDNINSVTKARNGNSRTAAIASRLEQQQQHREQQAQPTTRRGRPVETTQPVQAQPTIQRQYITNPLLLTLYPRRPGEFATPHYDPVKERLRAYLDDAGFLTFEVLQVKDMDKEAHETVIKTYASPTREKEYRNQTQRRAAYSANGYEIPPSMVENAEVARFINDKIAKGELKSGATFMDLSEKDRTDIISVVAQKRAEERELKSSQKLAEAIESGNANEFTNRLELVQVQLTKEVASVRQAINRFISMFGSELDSDDAQTAYTFTYNIIDTLWTCEDPSRKRILSNLLTGLKSNGATVEKLVASLSNSNLPLPLFANINTRATQAINEAIHYLIGLRQLTVDDFIGDINDLAEWFVQQVQEGNLTNDQVDTVNRYVCRRVCNLSEPKIDQLKRYYPDMTDEQLEASRLKSIYTYQSGNIVWVPFLAGELGLHQGVNEVNYMDNLAIRTIFSRDRNYLPNDYLCTKDGILFRLVGWNGTSTLVLETQSM